MARPRDAEKASHGGGGSLGQQDRHPHTSTAVAASTARCVCNSPHAPQEACRRFANLAAIVSGTADPLAAGGFIIASLDPVLAHLDSGRPDAAARELRALLRLADLTGGSAPGGAA